MSQDPPVSDGRPRALCRPAGSSDPSTSKEAMNINGWKMLEDVGRCWNHKIKKWINNMINIDRMALDHEFFLSLFWMFLMNRLRLQL